MEAIRANPDDDLPRLVFADSLEERGQAEEANFIRLQCHKPGEALLLEYAPHRKEITQKHNITPVAYSRGFCYDAIFHPSAKRLHMLIAYGFSVLTRVSGMGFKDNMQVAATARGANLVLTMSHGRYIPLMYKATKDRKEFLITNLTDMSDEWGSSVYYEITATAPNPHREHELLTKLRSDIRLAYLRQEYLKYVESKGIRNG